MDYKSVLAIGLPLGLGIVAFASAMGLGKSVAAAMEATGRQPEAAGQVRTSMIISAALIEGATFFGLAICILLAVK